MQSYAGAELIYVGMTKESNGSPKAVTITLSSVPVKEISTFSLNYYTSRPNSRQMRKSKNLVVAKEMTEDRTDSTTGVVCELMYVVYHDTKYTVKEILKYYKRDHAKILDCEETR